jgi:hypothetical protein
MISLETERQIRREWALRAEHINQDDEPSGDQDLHPQERAALHRRLLAAPLPSPFHPDYGLPQPHRLKVLHLADQTNPATAAETYNVGLSTIYNWRRIMRGA